MARIPLVDENDEVIGFKERADVAKNDVYRVAALWITNSKNEVLLARRAFSKANDPGKWGPAVAGTVEEGETYESNIVKEAREELGLVGFAFEEGVKLRQRGEHNFFVQRFSLKLDRPATAFKIQASEVAEVKWFSKTELTRLIASKPSEFLPSVRVFAGSE